MLAVEVSGRPVVLTRFAGRIYAMDDRCSHAGARLSGGRLRDGVISCPLHGGRFEVATGHCLSKALGFIPVTAHATRELDGMIAVCLAGVGAEGEQVK